MKLGCLGKAVYVRFDLNRPAGWLPVLAGTFCMGVENHMTRCCILIMYRGLFCISSSSSSVFDIDHKIYCRHPGRVLLACGRGNQWCTQIIKRECWYTPISKSNLLVFHFLRIGANMNL